MPLPSDPLVATYSIVARDAETGEFGVAVQSNYFSVGTLAPWSEPGVGAVATQAIVEVSYGPKGLALLAAGASAKEALAQLVEADPGAALRQVAIVDNRGGVATHTGDLCVPTCGHLVGEGYSVQGNMLASDAVWQAMGPAFEQAKGDLADRLMAALEAAEAAGGDVRGRQSAALLVTSADRTPNAWEGQRFDLHVEDHPRPLEELRRLLDIHRAYAMFEEARVLIGDGRVEESLVLVERALAIRPGEPQFTFWTGLALANLGRDAEARSFLKQSFEANEGWRQLGLSLKSIGFYSGDPALLEA